MFVAACAAQERRGSSAAKPAPPPSPWDEAKARGIEFRAVGNEPGWHVEVDQGERITMVTDYGASRAVTPAPEPEIDGVAGATYHAETEAHRLALLLEEKACRDTMSGKAFPTTVTATLDGREYQGCGRWLIGSARSVSNIESWVGRKLVRKGEEARAGSRDVLERDLPEPYRILPPGAAADGAAKPERLNILLDAKGAIADVYWG